MKYYSPKRPKRPLSMAQKNALYNANAKRHYDKIRRQRRIKRHKRKS